MKVALRPTWKGNLLMLAVALLAKLDEFVLVAIRGPKPLGWAMRRRSRGISRLSSNVRVWG
jgi:hypothetical protein